MYALNLLRNFGTTARPTEQGGGGRRRRPSSPAARDSALEHSARIRGAGGWWAKGRGRAVEYSGRGGVGVGSGRLGQLVSVSALLLLLAHVEGHAAVALVELLAKLGVDLQSEEKKRTAGKARQSAARLPVGSAPLGRPPPPAFQSAAQARARAAVRVD